MNPESHPEETIFSGALALPPAERAAYVAAACRGDDALRSRVEALLRAHEAGASLLQGSPGEQLRTAFVRPANVEQPGTMIDRYKLLQKIGEGGCGIVYMAEQEEPVRRRVALKIIKLGMDTKEVVARFEAERQALALMDHPNIARVFDGGTTTTGRPYFVMELVRGVPITRYCDDNNLPTARRLELFVSVCQAVQHAHQKGIIHRDLKPSNVLVTENDGAPVAKVIDFGIAKATQGRLTDATLFTAFEQFIGTPAYMSPEQAAMTSLDVDTRSDIYSLGVLLYELLTGEPPFSPKKLMAAGFDEIRRLIREVDPPRPSTRLTTLTDADRATVARMRGTAPADLSATLSGDLDWIVMRCLEKDRTRRYESASALALDLQHYRNDLPVMARPPSRLYVLRKLVARNKLTVGAAAVVTVALIAGLVTSTLAYFNEKAAHQFAVEASQSLQKAMAETLDARTSGGDALRQEAERSVYAFQVMQALLHGLNPASMPADAKARILPLLDEAVVRLRHEPQIRPATKQQLLDSAGDIFLAFDETARAENVFRQVLSIRQIILGAGHPDTAAARQKLLEVLRRQGKPTEEIEPAKPATAVEGRTTERNAGLIAQRRARDLRLEGRYAEADAQLRLAHDHYKREMPPNSLAYSFSGVSVLMQMARLRVETGETRGLARLAQYRLEEEKCQQGWFRYGALAGLGINAARGSFEAHTLLGLVALQEGDRQEAVLRLLRSADGIVHNPFMYGGDFKFGAQEVRLAAGLLAVHETAAVLEFLDRVRRSYVAALGERGTTLFTNWSWEEYYQNSAKGRVLAGQLEAWRQEILAGKTPAEWLRVLEADRPAIEPEAVQLGPLDPHLAGLPKLPSSWPGILAPSLLLCLGWFAVGFAHRPGVASPLRHTARTKLLALAAVRVLAVVLFALTFIVEGFNPSGLFIFVLTVLGWRLLWDFIQALAPTLVTRRENTVFQVFFWASLVIPTLVQTLTYLSKSDWILPVFGIGALLTFLLSLAMVLSVCTLFGWRLWKWKPDAGLRRAKIVLLLSGPLILLHAFACLFMPVFQEGNPRGALFLLWADALFPWLLLIGLPGRITSPTMAAPAAAA